MNLQLKISKSVTLNLETNPNEDVRIELEEDTSGTAFKNVIAGSLTPEQARILSAVLLLDLDNDSQG